MTTVHQSAREQLLEIRPQSEQVLNHLLDAYRDQVLTEAADIAAAGATCAADCACATDPTTARGAAARIRAARTGQEG